MCHEHHTGDAKANMWRQLGVMSAPMRLAQFSIQQNSVLLTSCHAHVGVRNSIQKVDSVNSSIGQLESVSVVLPCHSSPNAPEHRRNIASAHASSCYCTTSGRRAQGIRSNIALQLHTSKAWLRAAAPQPCTWRHAVWCRKAQRVLSRI